MEYEVQRCTRHCAATGRELCPGESYYSVLTAQGADLVRLDYAGDAWPGPPAESVAWWKSQIPGAATRRSHWAPNDAMLDFFDLLEGQPDNQDMRYVLALLLVRRRVMRIEEGEGAADDGQTLSLYCPRRDVSYQVAAVVPSEARIEQIQEELARLLQ
jgi:hypothetical protein